MRAAFKCLLFGSLLTLLSCSKGGAPAQPTENNISNSKSCGTRSAALLSETARDPFLARGKVLLENTNALASDREVTVTLDIACAKQNTLSTAAAIQEQNKETALSGLRAYTWTLPVNMTYSELREVAEADACIHGIADSGRAFMSSLNDPLVPSQGHLKMLEAGTVEERLASLNLGRKVVIAVVDSGIDLNHEDLRNVLWKNRNEIPANEIDDDGNGYIDDVYGYNFALKIPSPSYDTETAGYQHGTHVAGLAAAQGGNSVGGSGVMGSGAQVMMLNVFGAGSGAYTSDIVNAIRYAADNGADVINLSLGGIGRSATYEAALNYAISKGVVIVAAAGNDHKEVGDTYWMSPGAYAKQFDGMLSIGSVDSATDEFSYYSNYSSDYVELAAPGAENARTRFGLLSTWPGGTYARIQGTSMASPVAAGAAGVAIAMMRARGYAPSPATIEELLEASAISDPNLTSKVRDGRVLNLRALKDFIESNYSYHVGAAIDPGVPGCGR